MRCSGLTTERRRCSEEVLNGAGFCSAHLPDSARVVGASAASHGARLTMSRLLGRKRLAPDQILIQDDAKYDLPRSIRSCSTPTLADRLLTDSDMRTRWMAAFALRKRRDPSMIEPLWQALTKDEVDIVRQQTAVALGKVGVVRVLGPLVEALWHDSSPMVRQACAVALGNLGYRYAARDLVQVLARDPVAFVRWDCAVALAQVGDRSCEAAIVALAGTEKSDVVRRACIEALEEIRTR